MVTLFNDPSARRESSQWRAIFATPSIDDTNTQLFANFGSMHDVDEEPPDLDSVIGKVAEQFAVDVFMELQSDLVNSQSRWIHTSQGGRQVQKGGVSRVTYNVVTPANARRRVLPRGNTPMRDNRLGGF